MSATPVTPPKNLGTKTRTIITLAKHPDVDSIAREGSARERAQG